MKYIKIYNKGFEQGIIDAYKDALLNKEKIFKEIDDNDIKSKLYDIGYIKGYKKLIFDLKKDNNSLN